MRPRSISVLPSGIGIMVSHRPIEAGARNSFEGKIERIEDHGTVIQVTVDTGVPFIVSLTRR